MFTADIVNLITAHRSFVFVMHMRTFLSREIALVSYISCVWILLFSACLDAYDCYAIKACELYLVG